MTIYPPRKDTPLPPYDPEAKCPMCGHDEVRTTHLAEGCSDPTCSVCRKEHLCRTCQRCHFQWAEATLIQSGTSGNQEGQP